VYGRQISQVVLSVSTLAAGACHIMTNLENKRIFVVEDNVINMAVFATA
jgi:hypothetical protein